MTDPVALWDARADRAQAAVHQLYAADDPQYLHNWYPGFAGSDDTFNYWWLAHLIDARLDAFERTGDGRWLAQAVRARDNLVARNDGGLFNDYFDDMLWFALASHRLAGVTGAAGHAADAVAVWEHVVAHGWNDAEGTSLAWRTQQLAYKNTPANGPLVILSARLHADTGEDRYAHYARTAFDWITRTLVRPEDGFVEDGINREGDHRVDTQWRFTYNQGLYVGAAVELARLTGSDAYLDVALRTARTAVAELTDGDVFRPEGDDGDEGLFKGIYYRYLMTLLRVRPDPGLADFVRRSTDVLWSVLPAGGPVLPANDWRHAPHRSLPYSTLLSAVMATEARAELVGARRSGARPVG
ncbi:MAG TPA: glycoside hydrolase family 76 protein [Cellulomonas sp.]